MQLPQDGCSITQQRERAFMTDTIGSASSWRMPTTESTCAEWILTCHQPCNMHADAGPLS